MNGAPNHSRDAFEFTLHDLQHMEHFCDEDSHLEQRGFFMCMLRLGTGRPREFFCSHCGLDSTFWHQLEYVLSDMNCYVPHLLLYTLAKIVEAVNREEELSTEKMDAVTKQERMHRIWPLLLDAMGMTATTGDARLAADALYHVTTRQRSDRPALTRAEAESLRCWFQAQVREGQ